jgi:excisionase family DNA binding protein
MNEETEGAARGDEGAQDFLYELKSVKEAADMLRVSESTVWRYADQDLLPTYRLGLKQIRFRASDLESLIYRVPTRKKLKKMNMTERLRLTAMSEGRTKRAGDIVARAASLRAEILARRGGEVTTEAWVDINDAREERSADL